jgi:membrane fusion protein (multidrug efflux system)
MAIIPDKTPWVVANFKETQLTRLREGQRVVIEVDAFPGAELAGTVESLQNGTGALFALLPADNATGNFTKVVQRVPVKILLDPGQDGTKRLRPGMSVVATVATD